MKLKIKLKIATRDDVLEIDTVKSNKKKVSWKLRLRTPYWMINSRGKIENKNYVISETTNAKEFGSYIKKKQILILEEIWQK